MIQSLIDLFFPPLCLRCHQRSSTPYFCPACWEQSRLIDPEERCLHCFNPVDESRALCALCRKHPKLPFPRAAVFDLQAPIVSLLDEEAPSAIAGFAYYQWARLDLPQPDCVVPIGRPSKVVAELASLLGAPLLALLRRPSWPLKQERFELKEGLIEEGAHILLFDERRRPEELLWACRAISEAFPQRASILSLVL